MAHILVIDAEPTVRSIVVKILQRAGHAVRATGDFQEAVTLLHGLPADLVVTNVFLNGITGHQAMLKLKHQFPRIRVLMISGLPDEDSVAAWAGEESRFDVFPKPFAPNSLVEKVQQMLVMDGNR